MWSCGWGSSLLCLLCRGLCLEFVKEAYTDLRKGSRELDGEPVVEEVQPVKQGPHKRGAPSGVWNLQGKAERFL